jgi:hypothetical protein
MNTLVFVRFTVSGKRLGNKKAALGLVTAG